jgi:hypothetical protein
VRDSLLVQRATMDFAPECPASRCFRVLAARLSRLAPGDVRGLRTLHLAREAQDFGRPVEAGPCA